MGKGRAHPHIVPSLPKGSHDRGRKRLFAPNMSSSGDCPHRPSSLALGHHLEGGFRLVLRHPALGVIRRHLQFDGIVRYRIELRSNGRQTGGTAQGWLSRRGRLEVKCLGCLHNVRKISATPIESLLVEDIRQGPAQDFGRAASRHGEKGSIAVNNRVGSIRHDNNSTHERKEETM